MKAGRAPERARPGSARAPEIRCRPDVERLVSGQWASEQCFRTCLPRRRLIGEFKCEYDALPESVRRGLGLFSPWRPGYLQCTEASHIVEASQKAFEAWRTYSSSGRLDARLLRPPVYRAWERCHEAGVNPSKVDVEVLSDVDTARAIDSNWELVSAAQPYMRALARAAGVDEHSIALCDEWGIILDVHGPAFATRYRPGTCFSETHAGANGIATAAVEGDYVELTGPEHFLSCFHEFTCQGIPVRGLRGDKPGALCVTSRAPNRWNLRRILEVAVRGIEAELVAARLRSCLQESRNGGAWEDLERLSQDLSQIHTAGRLEFELAALAPSGAVDGDELVRSAYQTLERFTRLSRLWQVLAEPIDHAEPVPADSLVVDSIDLLQTEARFAGVTVRIDTVACGNVVGVSTSLQALLKLHRLAFRRAGDRGLVEVSLDERGRVRWTVTPADEPRHVIDCKLHVG